MREYLRAYWAAGRAAYSQANAVLHVLATLLPALALAGVSQISPLPWWAAVLWVAFYIAAIVPYRMWKEQHKQIAELTSPHGPDMPIAELFDLVGEGVGDFLDPRTEGWRVIGMKVMDKLSTGELTGWGRRLEGGITALAEIPRNYWSSAQWSYYFLALKDDKLHHGPHVWPLHATLELAEREQYFDVHVNRAQASRIWRRAKKPKHENA